MPSDATIPLHELRLDEQGKLVRNAHGVIDVQGRASLRHVPDRAIDGGGHSEYDGATLKGPQPWTAPLFHRRDFRFTALPARKVAPMQKVKFDLG